MKFSVSHDYGEIAAYYHVEAEGLHFRYKPSEIRIHFGSPSCNVYHIESRLRQNIEALFHRLPGHNLPSVRAGIHVTVGANLIAHFADVDLENSDPGWF